MEFLTGYASPPSLSPLGQVFVSQIPLSCSAHGHCDLTVTKSAIHPPSSSDQYTSSSGHRCSPHLCGPLSLAGLWAITFLGILIYPTGYFFLPPFPLTSKARTMQRFRSQILVFLPCPLLTQGWSLFLCHDFQLDLSVCELSHEFLSHITNCHSRKPIDVSSHLKTNILNTKLLKFFTPQTCFPARFPRSK